MKTIKELTFIDKTDWGDGPWQHEPDKVQMIDEATGFDCLIVRGPHGALCGYVGVDSNHPLYGKEYSDDAADHIEIHCGLTFSDFCVEDKKELGICHTPLPGRPDKVWWLGFDCAHAFDLSPVYNRRFPRSHEKYRDINYVKKQCAELALQLKETK